jgi:hypothetical protein
MPSHCSVHSCKRRVQFDVSHAAVSFLCLSLSLLSSNHCYFTAEGLKYSSVLKLSRLIVLNDGPVCFAKKSGRKVLLADLL